MTGDLDETYILSGGYTWNTELMFEGLQNERAIITRTNIDLIDPPFRLEWAKTYDLGSQGPSHAVQALAIEPTGA